MSTPIIRVFAETAPTEGAVGTYRMTLNTPAPVGGLTVNFNTLGSTATLNSDYNFALGENLTAITGNSFTIAEGATSATLNLVAHTDYDFDPDESVVVNLTDDAGYDVVQFTSESSYPTALYPFSFGVGDFNNDGKLDFALSNLGANTISVFMRNTDNTGFDTPIHYATGGRPQSIGVGDFNNDGRLDLAVTNAFSYSVSVFLRNADNTGFESKRDYATGAYTTSVDVGDFNNDGKLDLVATNRDSDTVSVLLRNADNTGFDSKIDYATGDLPQSVSVGDFNGDGKLDFAVANAYSHSVSIFLRNTDNTGFNPKMDYATGLYPSSGKVGDFNNDGKLDLVVVNSDSSAVSVLLRNTDNTGFDAPVAYDTGLYPQSISVGDLNNDGKLDLAVANWGSNTVSILLRNADNTGFDAKADYTASIPIHSVGAGDFNNDGKLDLLASHYMNGSMSVLLNNSSPTATLIITNTFVNHAPVLTTPAAINYTDTKFDDSFATVNGLLVASDIDGDSLTYGFVGGTDDGYGHVYTSTPYGRFEVSKATGNYQFVPNDNEFEALNANALVSFTVTVSDGQITTSKSLDIKITQVGQTETNGNDRLVGTDGNDVFNGLAGDDLINGLAGDDILLGGAGVDTLQGGAGKDWLDFYKDEYGQFRGTGHNSTDFMQGGTGDDSYWVDNRGDTVTERAGEGIDTVYYSIFEPYQEGYTNTYTLPNHLENLVHKGGYRPIGIGNKLDNTLTIYSGTSTGAGTLYGLEGDDTLISYHSKSSYNTLVGGKGDDSYHVNAYMAVSDVIVENAGEGEDTVYVSADRYTLADNLENLVFISGGIGHESGSFATGTGNALNNHLTSSLANTRLEGLAGNDNYYVGNEGVSIIEAANQGWDTVLSTTNRTLEANVEELYLQGTANLNGYGNEQNNNLNGNVGNNILDGRGGADFMQGGAGNDTYLVDNTGDVVKERAGEGIDTVNSRVSYTLAANVENLNIDIEMTPSSIAVLTGTGNELANRLTGNRANNTLDGKAGADTLIGSDGNDLLIGGLGKDSYYLSETIAATDTVRIAKGDSLISTFDVATGFQLGINTLDNLGVDKLDLDSAKIAANANAVDGKNSGNIKSHHISDGIISFDDANHYVNPLAITQTDLASVFSYLQDNITRNDTVAFVTGGNTFVFQDGGATDTLVELVGVTAQSINTSGLAAGAVWIV